MLKGLIWKCFVSERSELRLKHILECYTADGTIDLIRNIRTLSKPFFLLHV